MNDEVELLTFRLNYLNPVVDKFVIFESEFTFSGNKKSFYGEEALRKSSISRNKVEFVRYTLPEEILKTSARNRWPLERLARSKCEEFVATLGSDYLFLISDLDEIPTRQQVEEARFAGCATVLPTPLYYRRANWLVKHGREWATAKIVPGGTLVDINTIRYANNFRVSMAEEGGHFSYLGSTGADLSEKLSNSAHAELDISREDAQTVQSFSDKYLIDHLGRFNRHGFGLIEVQRHKDLNSIQRELLESYPDYFNFHQSTFSLFVRAFASFRLWRAWKSKEFENLNDNPKVSERLCFLFYWLKFSLIDCFHKLKRLTKPLTLTCLHWVGFRRSKTIN